MSRFLAIIKICLSTVLLLVLLCNLVIVAVINFSSFRNIVLVEINKRVLTNFSTGIEIGNLGYSFLSRSLIAENVKIQQAGAIKQCDFNNCSPNLLIKKVFIGIDFVQSIKQKIMVISSITVDEAKLEVGISDDFNLQMPFIFKKSESSLTPLQFYKTLRNLMPAKVKIHDFAIIVRSLNQNSNFDTANISSKCMITNANLEILNSRRDYAKISVNNCFMSKSFPFYDNNLNIDINSLDFEGYVDNKTDVVVKKFSLNSSLFTIGSEGKLKLLDTKTGISGSLNFEARGNLFSSFKLIDIPAKGFVDINGKAVFDGLKLIPKIELDASWIPESNIDGFSLYKGNMSVKYSDQKIEISKFSFSMQDKGKIDGSGTIEVLPEKVLIKTKSKASQVSFIALMRGLDVAVNEIDFNVDASDLLLNVTINNQNNNFFELSAQSPIEISHLIVPSLHTKTRTPMPTCRGMLNLVSTVNLLNLKNTQVSCSSKNGDNISVKEGLVDYNTGKVSFLFEGTNLDLNNAQYFLLDAPQFFAENPTRGKVVTLRGSLSCPDTKTPFTFKSKFSASDVSLYGVSYKDITGEFGINDKQIFGNDIYAIMGENSVAEVLLTRFSVAFDEVSTAEFSGQIFGPLSALVHGVSPLLGEQSDYLKSLSGNLDSININLKGPLTPKIDKTPLLTEYPKAERFLNYLLNWDIFANIKASKIAYKTNKYEKFQLDLRCAKKTCENGRMIVEDVSNVSLKQDYYNNYLLVDLIKMSSSTANIIAKAQNFPFWQSISDNKIISSEINGNINLSGLFGKWIGLIKLNFDSIMYDNISILPIQMSIVANGDKNFDLNLEAANYRVRGRGKIPLNLMGDSELYFAIDNYDITGFLPGKIRENYVSDLGASLDVELRGPAPLSDMSQTYWDKLTETVLEKINGTPQAPKSWYDYWNLNGKINRLYGNIKGLTLVNVTNPDFEYHDGLLSINNFVVEANSNAKKQVRLEAGLSFNVFDSDLSFKTKGQLNLSSLSSLSGVFGVSDGLAEVELGGEGKFPDISINGRGKLKGGNILINAIPPALTNIDLNFLLHDKIIEIEEFSANKGDGLLNVTGIIDLADQLAGKDFLPKIRVYAELSGLQSRIPIPIFQSLDAQVDGKITLCRKNNCEKLSSNVNLRSFEHEPLLIVGKLNVQDARITRALECSVIRKSFEKTEEGNSIDLSLFALDLVFVAKESLSVDTKCARAKFTTEKLLVSGSLLNPQLTGKIELLEGTGSGQLANIKFLIDKSVLDFDGSAANPRLDMTLSTSVVGYKADRERVDYKITGRIDQRLQSPDGIIPEIRAEPATHPDGQRRLTQTDLILMIISGRGPDASAPVGISTDTVINEFYSKGTNAIFSEARLETSLTRMLNRLSAGFIDGLIIEPIFEAGRPRFRITTVMSLENLDVKMQYDQDAQSTENVAKNASITAQWILNNRINLGVDFQLKDNAIVNSLPIGAAMGAGIVFRFSEE